MSEATRRFLVDDALFVADVRGDSREQVVQRMVEVLLDGRGLGPEQTAAITSDFMARSYFGGLGRGFAAPHVKTSVITKGWGGWFRICPPVEWGEIDACPVALAFTHVRSRDEAAEHLECFADLARVLRFVYQKGQAGVDLLRDVTTAPALRQFIVSAYEERSALSAAPTAAQPDVQPVRIPLGGGVSDLHGGSCARIAQRIAGLDATITLSRDTRSATIDPREPMLSLMDAVAQLRLTEADSVDVLCSGPEAEKAVNALREAFGAESRTAKLPAQEQKAPPGTDPTTAADVAHAVFRVGKGQGIHMRPACLIATAAMQFASDVRVRKSEGSSFVPSDQGLDAKSMFDLTLLHLQWGDVFEIACSGQDAPEALEHLRRVLVELRCEEIPNRTERMRTEPQK